MIDFYPFLYPQFYLTDYTLILTGKSSSNKPSDTPDTAVTVFVAGIEDEVDYLVIL